MAHQETVQEFLARTGNAVTVVAEGVRAKTEREHYLSSRDSKLTVKQADAKTGGSLTDHQLLAFTELNNCE